MTSMLRQFQYCLHCSYQCQVQQSRLGAKAGVNAYDQKSSPVKHSAVSCQSGCRTTNYLLVFTSMVFYPLLMLVDSIASRHHVLRLYFPSLVRLFSAAAGPNILDGYL